MLRYAAAKAIGLDRQQVEDLTFAQIVGLSDAAREGKHEAFVASAEALGLVAAGSGGGKEADRKPAPPPTDPREAIKRQVAEEAAADQAAKDAAAAADKEKPKRAAAGKKVEPELVVEDKTPQRALALIEELAMITDPSMASAFYSLLDRGATKVVLRDVAGRDDLEAKVQDAIDAARGRIGPKQEEPPPADENDFPGDRP